VIVQSFDAFGRFVLRPEVAGKIGAVDFFLGLAREFGLALFGLNCFAIALT
jgi:hypothetical protein